MAVVNMNVLNKIMLLPKFVVEIEIFKFIPEEKLLFINKYYYEKNIFNYRFQSETRNFKKSGLLLDSYIIKLISNKYDYVFSLLIKHRYTRWIKIKKYKHKHHKYRTYIDFLEQLCINLNSTKCRNAINDYNKKNNKVRKKKYKKMKSFINRWSN